MQNFFVIALGCLFVFVLVRELMCWYWKINKSIELQEKILKELVKLNNDEKVTPKYKAVL